MPPGSPPGGNREGEAGEKRPSGQTAGNDSDPAVVRGIEARRRDSRRGVEDDCGGRDGEAVALAVGGERDRGIIQENAGRPGRESIDSVDPQGAVEPDELPSAIGVALKLDSFVLKIVHDLSIRGVEITGVLLCGELPLARDTSAKPRHTTPRPNQIRHFLRTPAEFAQVSNKERRDGRRRGPFESIFPSLFVQRIYVFEKEQVKCDQSRKESDSRTISESPENLIPAARIR